MKKSLIITALAVLVMVSSNGICQAKTDIAPADGSKTAPIKAEAEVNASAEKPAFDNEKQPLQFDEGKNHEEGLPPGFEGKKPPKFDPNKPPQHFQPPSKEEMDKKKAEIEKRLKLTAKQKKKIEENKIKDRENIKPIFDEMNAKKQELEKLRADETLSQAEKVKQENSLNKEIGKLKQQLRSAHEKNMKNFESVLTKKQKKEFAKIKKEQRKDMGKRRHEFERARKGMPPHHHDMHPPFPPQQPQQPLEEK